MQEHSSTENKLDLVLNQTSLGHPAHAATTVPSLARRKATGVCKLGEQAAISGKTAGKKAAAKREQDKSDAS